MWLFTKYGFYSIVKDYKDPKLYKCRARSKKDLLNLIANFKYLKDYSIQCDKKADYHYRIFISQNHFSMLMLSISNTIDYSNFKGHISRNKDQVDKVDHYSEVWQIMYTYQNN